MMSVLNVHSLANQERLNLNEATLQRVLRVEADIYETKLKLKATSVSVEVQAPPGLRPEITQVITNWLGLSDDPQLGYSQLSSVQTLAAELPKFPNLRLISYPDLFEALVITVLGQQISTSAARTLATRFVQAFGELHECGLHAFPTALTTAAHTAEELQQVIRCPLSRAQTLQRVAQWYVETGQQLAGKHQEFLASLQSLKGVGPWTRDYVALRGLRQNSIFLKSDLVVRRSFNQLGVGKIDGLQLPEEARSLATVLLWAMDAKKNEA